MNAPHSSRLLVAALAATVLAAAASPGAGGGSAPEPTREELASVDASLETVRDVCARTLGTLLAELRRRYPGIDARTSGGRSKRNDYRNYQWISVKFGDREYLLSALHGNLDVRTGNPHAQLGRIQFWRCAGPHGPHTRDEGGVWRFRADHEDRTLPAIRVWDDDFSSARVVDLFVAFLEANGEGEALAALAAGADPDAAPVEDLPSAERRRVDEALENVRAVEAKARSAIARELRTRHPDWKVREAHGNSRTNDYRAYQWIVVGVGGASYFVSLCYNDQDPATGNLHSQYGRIQFWSGIHHETDPRNEAGPHTRDEGGWRFRSDRQWDGLPRLHLWSPEYSSARVADLFEAFLRETREPPR